MGATWRLRHTGKVEIEVVGALADAIAADERRWSRFLAAQRGLAPQPRARRAAAGLDRDARPAARLRSLARADRRRLLGHGRRRARRLRLSREPARALAAHRRDSASASRSRARSSSSTPCAAWPACRTARRSTSAAWRACGAPIAPPRSCARSRTIPRSCSRSATTWSPCAAITSWPSARGDDDAGARAVVLRDGHALASSSWSALLWSNDDGVAAHHLIDPATGAPAEPASAVVIASDAAEADALSTAMAVRPSLVSHLATTCAMVHADAGRAPHGRLGGRRGLRLVRPSGTRGVCHLDFVAGPGTAK